MKTINFTFGCLLLLTSIPCFAQAPTLQKGSFLVGGTMDLSFANYKTELTSGFADYSIEGSGTSITFAPQVGYFMTEGLTIGGILNLTKSSTTDADDEKYIVSNFSVGPFMRYYTKSKIFFHGEYTFGTEKEKIAGPYDADSKRNVSGWKLGMGYAAFLNDNIALEPHFMYASNRTKDTGDEYDQKSTFRRIIIGLTFTLFLPQK